MNRFTLELSPTDLDVLQIALIDYDAQLSGAIRNERQCTNNSDTIETLTWHRIRIADIMLQLKIQKEQQ